MNSADAKMYLRQIKDGESAAGRLEDRLATINAEMAGIKGLTYDKEAVHSIPISDRLTELMIKYEDTAEELWALKEELLERRTTICEEIEQLEDERQRQVLYYLYVKHMSWDEVAKTMGYSRRWVEHIHGHALLEFAKRVR
ncbi:MAG: DUF1492 domain-containing protein [Blautia sp.]|nr:DUF1492 domain-containing protein [Blautia sp.]